MLSLLVAAFVLWTLAASIFKARFSTLDVFLTERHYRNNIHFLLMEVDMSVTFGLMSLALVAGGACYLGRHRIRQSLWQFRDWAHQWGQGMLG